MSDHHEAGPDRPVDAAIAEAVAAHVEDRLGDAERIYRRILADEPDHPVALNNLGLVLAGGGHVGAAVDALRRAVGVAPDSVASRVNLAEVLVASGRVDEASDHLEAAEAIDPADDEVQIRLAALEVRAGDASAAERRLWRVVFENPEATRAGAELSDLLIDDGRADLARSILDDALVGAPHEPELLSRSGWLHLAKGDNGAALDEFSAALVIAPDHTGALAGVAAALVAIGDIEGARAALRSRSGLAVAHRELGVLELSLGQFDQARTELNTAIAVEPEDPKSQFYCALVAALDGDDVSPLEAIANDPESPYHLRARAQLDAARARDSATASDEPATPASPMPPTGGY